MTDQANVFYKIVHAERPYVIPRRLEDIAKENFSAPGLRPLVLFTDPQEALEKSLWFYAHNILPLIGEPNNLAVTAFAAQRYGIDAIVGELPLVTTFLSRLGGKYDLRRITSLTLIGRNFDSRDVIPLLAGERMVRLVLVHPVIGSFAASCAGCLAAGELAFHPDPAAELFVAGGTLAVSERRTAPGTGRRVGTGLVVRRIKNTCACQAPVSFIIIASPEKNQP